MSDYIDRKALIDATEEMQFTMSHFPNKDQCDGANMARRTFARIFRILPAADVAPVRHGRWGDMGDFIYCSICNVARMKEFLSDYGIAMRLDVRTNYCPHCGAKMDGGADDVVD